MIDFYYGNRFCFTDWKGDGHIDILLSDYDVYTAEGRFVATAFHGYETAGARTRQWNVAGLPAGVYLIRLSADGRVRSRRLLVVR